MADDSEPTLPTPVVDRVTTLVRQARDTTDDPFTLPDRCETILANHGYDGRIRTDDDTLVLHPSDWVHDDGTAKLPNIDDTDHAIEVSLTGPNHNADWKAVEADNNAIVETIRQEHGDSHAENIRAFADFMGNHYLKRVTEATAAEREEFLQNYYRRNVWPTNQQDAVVEDSLALLNALDEEALDSL